ncbi:hypothetical protein [Bacteroidetes bacterium endosymbiont of Geopemphigus sp.]|uniref:hypothetical protein n=1 Tax=Bacteroidetes bacterium endosymbiont of Geopemphigus sp. TaxID=2047937 RepID=UPI000CD21AB3|nr:hypothetical protein [Bacteroidetes bacterium endosymbiont of Geopemphigus sp.]
MNQEEKDLRIKFHENEKKFNKHVKWLKLSLDTHIKHFGANLESIKEFYRNKSVYITGVFPSKLAFLKELKKERLLLMLY